MGGEGGSGWRVARMAPFPGPDAPQAGSAPQHSLVWGLTWAAYTPSLLGELVAAGGTWVPRHRGVASKALEMEGG